jgi:hypothetical protein
MFDNDFYDTSTQHLCPYCGAAFDEEQLGEFLAHRRHCAMEEYEEAGGGV